MTVFLDHTIVPAQDKAASARFLARVLGVQCDLEMGRFASVHVNETLSLNFEDREAFGIVHYAFHATDEEFDAILERVKAEGIPYGSGGFVPDKQPNTRKGGRGFYFKDPSGHSLEIITVR